MIIALLISLFLLLGTSLMGQNPPIALPADGDWPTVVGDSIMLIGPKQEALTEEQRYFNPPYLLVYPGKEHLKNDMIRAALCDCDPTKPNRRIGVFSVAPDKQVSFSQGNLQYLPAANIWKFADTQYEYLGNANKYLKPTFRNWVDLFGWSADNTTAPFGVSTSTNAADYAGSFVDWGTNEICGDAPGTWRTLSVDEWDYLLNGRENAEQLRTKGSVEGKEGVILLPDNWICPEGYTIAIIPDEANLQSNVNTYSQADWSKLEAAGAIILPSAGMRRNATELEVRHPNIFGGYWTCTNKDEHNSYCYTFHTQDCEYMDYSNHIYGRSVRLVHDTIVPKPEYVDLGLSVKWATFNVGATSPEDYGDYFAWGETEPKETYSWANYKWCEGTSTNMTKYNAEDGKTILEPADDAAHVNWGGNWRMPSKEEVDELTQQCSWIWTTHNNVNGYKVTGPNGNSIFLPAAGYKGGGPTYPAGEDGLYWTNTTEQKHYSYLIVLHDDAPPTQAGRQGTRCFGFTIRPVYDDIPDPCLVVKVNDTLSINMMCVEGGTFTMGQGENAHPVSLSSYSICQTEVTQALWEAVIGTNPSANTTNKELPVTNVSWYDCQAFIKKLNQLTGMRFRLPTEAEWEYASRGGQKSKGYTYAGSNDLKEVAWYNGNSGNTLHPVAQKKPNELGIYDMSGNAWEWCHDWHAPYPTTHQYNPLGPEVGKVVGKRYLRVFRGGSYGYEAAYHQNAFRDITGPEPNIGTSNLGLRLVLSDEVNFQTIHVNDTLSFHMMDVKGGTFTMGDNNISIASPAHQVTLSDYYIGETEVTQALWKSVMGNIPTGNKNPSYPVGYVTYADCQNFIAKLNNLTGLHFQLPTEAEWEYAAMGGNKSHNYIYSGSNTIDDVAWYDQNSENKMHNVGVKQPNELGIYDMSGNAWEWCADYYDKYTADPKTDPKGPTTGTGRVIRSGSFRTTAERCSNKHRQAREADYPDSHITFRLVLHDTTPEPPKRIGVFSVGADKQVSFSQGNLQYVQSTDTWQFAANQLEYMGHKHYRNGQLADTIEYFGWSGKNSKTPWGISLSTESSDYAGEFLDWGTNSIAGSAPNTWRTLSNEELLYICQGRKNADQLLGLGTIGTVTGLIILPDDWQLPAGLSFTPNTDNATKNQYTYNQWAVMENAGAVFLPPTGYFNHKLTNMRGVNELGYYRGSTLADDGRQIYMLYANSRIRYSLSGNNDGNLYYAFSVRLVHDTIVPEPEYVDLGLSVKWATFNVGATSPNEIGNFYAWGEIEPKDTYTVNNYKWWNKSSKEITKYCTIDSLAYGDVADGLTGLLPQDDVAHILKGEHWRMPNLDECKELVNGCTWTVSTRQGQIGFEGTSKINGNTIFLPVAGFRAAGANLVHETLGGYWSSTLNIEKQSCAMGLYLNQETPAVNIYYNSNRQNGFLIRPVYDDRP